MGKKKNAVRIKAAVTFHTEVSFSRCMVQDLWLYKYMHELRGCGCFQCTAGISSSLITFWIVAVGAI